MAGQNFDGKIALASSAFALGLVAGLLLKRGAGYRWLRDLEPTVTFDENLPDQLGRREPVPHAGEPRFGGTGALGISPLAADIPTTGD